MVWWVIRTDDRINKQMLYKSLGNARLIINELEEIALNIEINLNKRPLTYVENDIELPVLTPNSLINSHSIRIAENEFDDDDTNLLKRQRYKPCKQAVYNC